MSEQVPAPAAFSDFPGLEDQQAELNLGALPPGWHLVEVAERPDRFTATEVERSRKRVAAILECIARRLPVKTVAALAGVSDHVVTALVRRHPALVATAKQRLAEDCDDVARLIVESLREDVLAGKLPAGQKSVAAGILIDKSAQLRGEANVVIEHRRSEASVDDVRRYLAGLKEAGPIEGLKGPPTDSKSIDLPADCAGLGVGNGDVVGDVVGVVALAGPGPSGLPELAGAADPLEAGHQGGGGVGQGAAGRQG